MLYSIGKKNYGSYAQPPSNFIGAFTDYQPEFQTEYLKLKKKSLREALGDKKQPRLSKEEHAEFIKKFVQNNLKLKKPLPSTRLSTILDVPDRTLRAYSQEIRLKSALVTGKI